MTNGFFYTLNSLKLIVTPVEINFLRVFRILKQRKKKKKEGEETKEKIAEFVETKAVV